MNEDREFDARLFYKTKLLKMILLLVGWTLFYGIFFAVLLPALKGEQIVTSDILAFMLTFKGSDCPHLWYMFLLVGLYLMIPVLRLFVKRQNVKYVVGFAIACTVLQFAAKTLDIFTVNAKVSVSAFMTKFHLEPATGYIGYLLLGWLFANYPIKRKYRIIIYMMGAIAFLGSTAAVQLLINDIAAVRDYVYEAPTLPAMLCGCAVFVLFLTAFEDRKTESKLVKELSRLSFGIYIIHMMFDELLVQLVLPYSAFPIKSPSLYIILASLMVLAASYLLTYAVSKHRHAKYIFYLK